MLHHSAAGSQSQGTDIVNLGHFFLHGLKVSAQACKKQNIDSTSCWLQALYAVLHTSYLLPACNGVSQIGSPECVTVLRLTVLYTSHFMPHCAAYVLPPACLQRAPQKTSPGTVVVSCLTVPLKLLQCDYASLYCNLFAQADKMRDLRKCPAAPTTPPQGGDASGQSLAQQVAAGLRELADKVEAQPELISKAADLMSLDFMDSRAPPSEV